MGETILVLDYSKSLRTLYGLELSEEGYQIVMAENEDKALSLLKEVCPDLVIIDGELLLSNGISPLERIRTYCDRTLIVLNHANDAACKNLLGATLVDACLVKSSDIDQLRRTIKEVLGEKRPPGEC